MRIATLFPLYTIYSFLSVCFPNAYVYLVGWTKVFQGVALYWFLMLLCDFVVPNDSHRAEFFASTRVLKRYSKTNTTDGLSRLKVGCFILAPYCDIELTPPRSRPGSLFYNIPLSHLFLRLFKALRKHRECSASRGRRLILLTYGLVYLVNSSWEW